MQKAHSFAKLHALCHGGSGGGIAKHMNALGGCANSKLSMLVEEVTQNYGIQSAIQKSIIIGIDSYSSWQLGTKSLGFFYIGFTYGRKLGNSTHALQQLDKGHAANSANNTEFQGRHINASFL